MWLLHMTNHAKGVLPGAVPTSWSCQGCSSRSSRSSSHLMVMPRVFFQVFQEQLPPHGHAKGVLPGLPGAAPTSWSCQGCSSRSSRSSSHLMVMPRVFFQVFQEQFPPHGHAKGVLPGLPGAVPTSWSCQGCSSRSSRSSSHLMVMPRVFFQVFQEQLPPHCHAKGVLPGAVPTSWSCQGCSSRSSRSSSHLMVMPRVFFQEQSVFCSEGNSIAENSVDTWTKLLMLPKCVLPTTKRGGQHNKPIPIDTLCGLWLKGNLCELCHRAQTRVAISKQSKRAPSNKVVASVMAKYGLYGKACQMLTSQGIAPNDDNTWNLLVSKHPQGDCPSNPAAPSVEAVLQPDFNIISVLRSFSKLAAQACILNT
eukprot:Em0013g34a